MQYTLATHVWVQLMYMLVSQTGSYVSCLMQPVTCGGTPGNLMSHLKSTTFSWLCMQNEVKLLLELLPKYYAHVGRHPHTLLIKFYGLYRVVPNNGSKVCSINPLACLVI